MLYHIVQVLILWIQTSDIFVAIHSYIEIEYFGLTQKTSCTLANKLRFVLTLKKLRVRMRNKNKTKSNSLIDVMQYFCPPAFKFGGCGDRKQSNHILTLSIWRQKTRPRASLCRIKGVWYFGCNSQAMILKKLDGPGPVVTWIEASEVDGLKNALWRGELPCQTVHFSTNFGCEKLKIQGESKYFCFCNSFL